MSVAAAVVLIALKLATGLATHSLGLLSEALHSGTDLVAALLTFFAVGLAARPADRGHSYGHGKAEHLAALAEGAILVLLSVFVAFRAIQRLAGNSGVQVDAAWYAFAVVGAVIAIDASRTLISWRASREFGSAALQSNALHFFSDLLGSSAVLVGLVAVRGGFDDADSIAALFVAALVLVAATRLMRTNVDVLDGPRARRRRGGGARRDRRHHAGRRPQAPAHARGGRPPVRRRRDRRPCGRRRRARSCRRRPGGRGGAERPAAKRRRRARRARRDAGNPRPRAGRRIERRSRPRGAQRQRAAARRRHGRGVPAPEAPRRPAARGGARRRRAGRARDPCGRSLGRAPCRRTSSR